VRIEHDRHRLGLSLREARAEAEDRGWRFDDQGRVLAIPPEAAEAFPDEARVLDARLAARQDEASRRVPAPRAEEPAADGAREREREREEAPPLTAMAAAMQQAQERAQSEDDASS
jgi:hypothetical protein